MRRGRTKDVGFRRLNSFSISETLNFAAALPTVVRRTRSDVPALLGGDPSMRDSPQREAPTTKFSFTASDLGRSL